MGPPLLCRGANFTACQDMLPYVNWLVRGSMMPGGRISAPAIDLGLWLAMQLTYGKISWLFFSEVAEQGLDGTFDLGGVCPGWVGDGR